MSRRGDAALGGERLALLYPPDPRPGALVVAVPEGRLDELKALERDPAVRVWRVRGIVADSIPLAGSVADAIRRPAYHSFYLEEGRPKLSIYAHHGGDRAVYYDLVAGRDQRVEYVEVRVATALTNPALVYGREALNQLLDAMARWDPPIVLQLRRLELLSPRDDAIVAYELVMPFNNIVEVGTLGGIDVPPPFTPYDAILRDAYTTTSPFYRLLCACRIYEGTAAIRKWLKVTSASFGVTARIPKDPVVDPDELQRMLGPGSTMHEGIRTASDLFDRLKPHRNGIAHFLLKGGDAESHIHLSSGEMVREYSLGAAVLLRYGHQAIEELRGFYQQHLESHVMRGSILPLPEQRDRFVVRPPAS